MVIGFLTSGPADVVVADLVLYSYCDEEQTLDYSEIDLTDSDEDGLPDFYEELIGTDINDSDTDDDGKVMPVLEVQLMGAQLNSFSMDKLSADDSILNSEIPGFLGNAYEFTVENNIQEANLKFQLDPSIMLNDSINPAIYYWNEETQLLELVDGQVKENDGIRVILNHFSRFFRE